MTKAILRSVNTKNKLYKKLKSTVDSDRYEVLTMQLRNYKRILRRSIRRAKKCYYENLFKRIKNDSKKVWKVINSLTRDSKSRDPLPEKFLINGEYISDKQTIANEMNMFFLEIAEKTVSQLTSRG